MVFVWWVHEEIEGLVVCLWWVNDGVALGLVKPGVNLLCCLCVRGREGGGGLGGCSRLRVFRSSTSGESQHITSYSNLCWGIRYRMSRG